MKVIGEMVRVLGAMVCFAGFLWIKGPAITMAQYTWGAVAAGVGFSIYLMGDKIIRLSRGHRPESLGI